LKFNRFDLNKQKMGILKRIKREKKRFLKKSIKFNNPTKKSIYY